MTRFIDPQSLITKSPFRQVLLSFDVEEFDIPGEYGQDLDAATQFTVSLHGLQAVLRLLERVQVRVTFFVTANFALQYPELIRDIAQTHEIASHGFYHGSFRRDDLAESKRVLEEIAQAPVRGFRMARLQPVDDQDIHAAGYDYNSSLNPTWIPGRYNHLAKPRRFYYAHQVLNIPVSVTPVLRFPLFWLSFKNLPLRLYQMACQWTLQCDRYLVLYFHPWEFAAIQEFGLPRYICRHAGQPMLRRLERFLMGLKPQAVFITHAEFLERGGGDVKTTTGVS